MIFAVHGGFCCSLPADWIYVFSDVRVLCRIYEGRDIFPGTFDGKWTTCKSEFDWVLFLKESV